MAKKKSQKPAITGNVLMLALADITVDDGINPRAELNGEAVNDYVDAFRAGLVPPNLVVFKETKRGKVTYWLAHGFHRFRAALKAGLEKINCEVRDGNRKDAIVFACGQNAMNAVRRTNADKRRAVELLLSVHPEWTDRRIADAAYVHHQLVATTRKEVDDSSTSQREGKGGKVYTVENKPQEIPGDDGGSEPPKTPENEVAENVQNAPPEPPSAPPQSAPFDPFSGTLEDQLEAESEADAEEHPPTYPPSVPAASPEPQSAQNVARDQLGRILPTYLVDAFAKRGACKVASAEIGRTLANLRLLNKDEECGGFLIRRPYLETDLNRVSEFVRTRLAPYCVCPACDGDGDTGECPTCQGRGWLPRAAYHALPAPLKEKADSFKPWDAWEPDDKDAAAFVASTVDDVRERAAGGRDAHGVLVPKHLRDVFSADFLHEIASDLQRFAKVLSDAKNWLHWLKPETHQAMAQLIRYVQDSTPYTVCVVCEGDHAKSKTCPVCMTSGYHPQWSEEAGNNKAKEPTKKGKKGGGS